MSEIAPTIDLDLAQKLREDPEYRRAFFHAEASAEIARQLIGLRKRRDLTQAQLAKLAGTGQPAISRCERADYQNWTVSTLRSITDALDGRMRVIIEPAEDVLPEYETPKASAEDHRGDAAQEASGTTTQGERRRSIIEDNIAGAQRDFSVPFLRDPRGAALSDAKLGRIDRL